MSYKIALISFLFIMSVGISSFILIHNGYYPVAMVDFHIISAKSLEEDYQTALKYFQNAILTYGSDPQILKKPESQNEIKRAALNKLITDVLVYQEAKKRLGSDLETVTEKVISNNTNTNNPQLEKAVKEIYGLSLEDFKNQVLVAQAHREILEGRMNLNNENFDNWLKNVSGQAKVIILLPNFYWDGQQVRSLSQ